MSKALEIQKRNRLLHRRRIVESILKGGKLNNKEIVAYEEQLEEINEELKKNVTFSDWRRKRK